MWKSDSIQSNLGLTIISCVCLGNMMLYIAFKNLQTEYLRQKDYVGQNSITAKLAVARDGKRKDSFEHFIVNEPLLCKNKKVDLIIIICSSVDNFNQRSAIRKTWGNHTIGMYNIKIIFLLGTWEEHRFSKIKNLLSMEILQYRDIVQANFIDSYRNLTLKSISMLEWVKTYCSHAKFILKSDDDMYINIPNLFRALKNQVISEFLMGNLILGAKPVQDVSSKWYTEKSEFEGRNYPPYLAGPAYVISGSAISKLYKVSLQQKMFWIEDVFITGICAKVAGIIQINRIDMTYFTPRPYECTLKNLISGHKINWRYMRSIHREVLNNGSDYCNKSQSKR